MGRFTKREIGKLFSLSYPFESKRAGMVKKGLLEDKTLKNPAASSWERARCEFSRMSFIGLIKMWPFFPTLLQGLRDIYLEELAI